MKTIKFVGYLFTRYYSKGPKANISYFSTMCSMTLLGFMHLMQILIIIAKVKLIPITSSTEKPIKYITFLVVMIPIYFLMTFLYKKSDFPLLKEKYDTNWNKVFKGNILLVIYIICSFTLIFVLTFLFKK